MKNLFFLFLLCCVQISFAQKTLQIPKYENGVQIGVELLPDTTENKFFNRHKFEDDHGHSHLNKECINDFKTGTFQYADHGDKITIVRSKKKQIESWNGGKSQMIMKIKWLKDDEFVLTLIKEVNVTQKTGCLEVGDNVHVKLTACDDGYYYIKMRTVKCKEMFDKLVKVK